MNKLTKPLADLALEIAHTMGLLLHGHEPEVQSAALADCLSMWLAGHICETPEQTINVRENLLREHLKLVWQLMPANEEKVRERLEEIRKHAH